MKKTILFLLISLFSNLCLAQQDTFRMDKQPIFSGCPTEKNLSEQKKCSDESLLKFIAENLKYPAAAAEKKLEGTVVVSFLVDETGQVSGENVLRDLGLGCGEAALTVVRSMPSWFPAEQSGKKVKTKLTLPIRFSLKTKEAEDAQKFSIHWGSVRGDKTSKSQLSATASEQIFVRDAFGNAMKIAELVFIFEKKRKSRTAKVAGSTLDKSMKKLVKRVSPGGTFTISVSVQQAGKFVVIEKSFHVE